MKITWHNAEGIDESPFWLAYIQDLASDSSMLWVNYKTLPQKYMVEYTVMVLQSNASAGLHFDKLVLSCPSEAPNWQGCVNVAVAFGYTDIVTIDASLVSNVEPGPHSKFLGKIRYNHFTDPFFLNCYHTSWEENDSLEPEKRENKLVYLARIARPHRISMAVELLERNLTEHTVMSCGWHGWNYSGFSKYIPEKYRQLFPIVLTEESHIEDDSRLKNWGVNANIRASVFNLIAEASFDHVPINDATEYWQKSVVSEKTIKAYILRQFPIWLAPYGAVQEQRDLGFDVFDDIIDHSYDTEYRPYHRLELIAKEVERVYNKYSIEDMRNLLTEKWDRLERNVEHYKQMTPNTYLNKFLKWAGE
jgi:hypothetical protein